MKHSSLSRRGFLKGTAGVALAAGGIGPGTIRLSIGLEDPDEERQLNRDAAEAVDESAVDRGVVHAVGRWREESGHVPDGHDGAV